MINFEQEYKKLNQQQKKAVDTVEGPVMVIAGPGTGKTQTIALRIANILKTTQASAHNILCLTFTEAAVGAMRQRLSKMIGPLAYEVMITTFHGFCNEVIKSNPDAFPQIISGSEPVLDSDKVRILLECIDALPATSLLRPFKKPDTYLYDISSLISSLKRENQKPAQIREMFEQQQEFFTLTKENFENLAAIRYNQLTDATFSEFITGIAKAVKHSDPHLAYIVQMIENLKDEMQDLDEKRQRTALRRELINMYKRYGDSQQIAKSMDFAVVYESYQAKLAEIGSYDYEDMIGFVLDVFANNESLLRKYQERYQYVLVDEYQDTNTAQNEAVALLINFFDNPNVFVVGDDDQAIYRFQGASVENIFDFYEQFGNSLELITLVNNYRSQQLILDAAADVIDNNASRLDKVIEDVDKSLRSQLDLPKIPVNVVELNSPLGEMVYVSEQIKQLLANGVEAREIAVLYRNNRDVDDVVEILSKENVEFNKTRGVNILDEVLIVHLLALLRYLSKPVDDLELVTLLHSPFFDLHQLDLVKVYRYLYKNRTTLTEVLEDTKVLGAMNLEQAETLNEHIGLLARWHDLAYEQPLLRFFEILIHEAGIINYIFAQENKYELLELLDRFYEEIKKYSRSNKKGNLEEFLSHLEVLEGYNIGIVQETKVVAENGVQLMTAHGAKGLEFEYVFIVKTQDKKWGNNSVSTKIKLPLRMFDLIPGNEIEEERRLFFVALTRAKKQIFITYSNTNEEQKTLLPSQFVAEITTENKQEIVVEQDNNKLLDFRYQALNSLNLSLSGQEYLAAILKDYSLSVSHLLSYRRCPRCFLLTDLLHIPTPKSPTAAYGTAMHASMRDVLNYLHNRKVSPSVDWLQEKFLGYLAKQCLSQEDYDVYAENGTEILRNYYTAKQDSFQVNSLAETNISTQLAYGNGLVIPINGKIDRIDYLDDSKTKAIVADYKTGNPDSKFADLSKEKLGDYYIQLVFYKFLLESSRQIGVESGQIDFIEPSKRKGEYITKILEFDNGSVAAVRELINDTYQCILGLEFENVNEKDCYTPHLHELGVRL